MKVRLLQDHFGPAIHALAGEVVDLADDVARASIEAGYAEEALVPLEAAAEGDEPAPPIRATPAARRQRAVKGPREA